MVSWPETKWLAGKNDDPLLLADHLAGQRVEHADALHLVAEELDAGDDLLVGRVDLQDVAPHAEGAALQGDVVARELHVHQLVQDGVALVRLAPRDRQNLLLVLLRRAEAVDAGHRGDDDDVPALEHGLGGGVPQAVDLIVDGGVLLDVGVGLRDVGFRLVVVVVGDEILHRVVREELAELRAELRRQRLVVGDDQGRAAGPAAITFAIVKVLPEPVTPSRVCIRSPRRMPSHNFAIAAADPPAAGSRSPTEIARPYLPLYPVAGLTNRCANR